MHWSLAARQALQPVQTVLAQILVLVLLRISVSGAMSLFASAVPWSSYATVCALASPGAVCRMRVALRQVRATLIDHLSYRQGLRPLMQRFRRQFQWQYRPASRDRHSGQARGLIAVALFPAAQWQVVRCAEHHRLPAPKLEGGWSEGCLAGWSLTEQPLRGRLSVVRFWPVRCQVHQCHSSLAEVGCRPAAWVPVRSARLLLRARSRHCRAVQGQAERMGRIRAQPSEAGLQ